MKGGINDDRGRELGPHHGHRVCINSPLLSDSKPGPGQELKQETKRKN